MRILLADDERSLAAGLYVLPAYDRFHPDVVLMDILMPRFNGITISHALMSRNPGIKLVLCSGSLSSDHPFVASSGACGFLPKPFAFSQAKDLLEKLAANCEPDCSKRENCTGRP